MDSAAAVEDRSGIDRDDLSPGILLSQNPGDPWTLHWTRDPGCIPVTYASSAAAKLDQLTYAVAAINAVSCSHLCLSGPSASETAPDYTRAERRIHVQRGDFAGGNQYTIPVSSGRSAS